MLAFKNHKEHMNVEFDWLWCTGRQRQIFLGCNCCLGHILGKQKWASAHSTSRRLQQKEGRLKFQKQGWKWTNDQREQNSQILPLVVSSNHSSALPCRARSYSSKTPVLCEWDNFTLSLYEAVMLNCFNRSETGLGVDWEESITEFSAGSWETLV